MRDMMNKILELLGDIKDVLDDIAENTTPPESSEE